MCPSLHIKVNIIRPDIHRKFRMPKDLKARRRRFIRKNWHGISGLRGSAPDPECERRYIADISPFTHNLYKFQKIVDPAGTGAWGKRFVAAEAEGGGLKKPILCQRKYVFSWPQKSIFSKLATRSVANLHP
jgi:hypothetical protein